MKDRIIIDINYIDKIFNDLNNQSKRFENIIYPKLKNSYLSSCFDSKIRSIYNKLNNYYSVILKDYKNIISWCNDYKINVNGLEKYLLNNLGLGDITVPSVKNYLRNNLPEIENYKSNIQNKFDVANKSFNFDSLNINGKGLYNGLMYNNNLFEYIDNANLNTKTKLGSKYIYNSTTGQITTGNSSTIGVNSIGLSDFLDIDLDGQLFILNNTNVNLYNDLSHEYIITQDAYNHLSASEQKKFKENGGIIRVEINQKEFDNFNNADKIKFMAAGGVVAGQKLTCTIREEQFYTMSETEQKLYAALGGKIINTTSYSDLVLSDVEISDCLNKKIEYVLTDNTIKFSIDGTWYNLNEIPEPILVMLTIDDENLFDTLIEYRNKIVYDENENNDYLIVNDIIENSKLYANYMIGGLNIPKDLYMTKEEYSKMIYIFENYGMYDSLNYYFINLPEDRIKKLGIEDNFQSSEIDINDWNTFVSMSSYKSNSDWLKDKNNEEYSELNRLKALLTTDENDELMLSIMKELYKGRDSICSQFDNNLKEIIKINNYLSKDEVKNDQNIFEYYKAKLENLLVQNEQLKQDLYKLEQVTEQKLYDSINKNNIIPKSDITFSDNKIFVKGVETDYDEIPPLLVAYYSVNDSEFLNSIPSLIFDKIEDSNQRKFFVELSKFVADEKLKYMTNEEIDKYIYLFQNVSREEAANYFAYLENDLNSRIGLAEAKEYFEGLSLLDENAGLKTIKELALFGEGEITGFKDFLSNFSKIFNIEGKYSADEWKQMYLLQMLAGNYQAASSEEQAYFNSMIDGFGAKAYQIGQATGNMLPVMLLSLATGGVSAELGLSEQATGALSKIISTSSLGLSSYGATKNEALYDGKSLKEARKLAFSQASMEALSEEAFGAVPGIGSLNSDSILLNALEEGVQEGVQEGLSNTINIGVSGDYVSQTDIMNAMKDSFIDGAITSVFLTAEGEVMQNIISGKYNLSHDKNIGNIKTNDITLSQIDKIFIDETKNILNNNNLQNDNDIKNINIDENNIEFNKGSIDNNRVETIEVLNEFVDSDFEVLEEIDDDTILPDFIIQNEKIDKKDLINKIRRLNELEQIIKSNEDVIDIEIQKEYFKLKNYIEIKFTNERVYLISLVKDLTVQLEQDLDNQVIKDKISKIESSIIEIEKYKLEILNSEEHRSLKRYKDIYDIAKLDIKEASYEPEIKNLATTYATEISERAKIVEAQITSDMKSLESDISCLIGEEFKFKGIDSLARKIIDDATKLYDKDNPKPVSELTKEELNIAASKIGDGLRYTLIINFDNYKYHINKSLNELESKGYKVVNFKNYWHKDFYKGINVSIESPDGFIFELQFHTIESFKTKETLTHDYYQIKRNIELNKDTKDFADKIQVEYQKLVEIPNDILYYEWESNLNENLEIFEDSFDDSKLIEEYQIFEKNFLDLEVTLPNIPLSNLFKILMDDNFIEKFNDFDNNNEYFSNYSKEDYIYAFYGLKKAIDEGLVTDNNIIKNLSLVEELKNYDNNKSNEDFMEYSNKEIYNYLIEKYNLDFSSENKVLIDLETKILDKMPNNLNIIEKIRYIYLELSKSVEYSDLYANATFDNNSQIKEQIYNKNINLNNADINNIICVTWTKLYSELLEKVGISPDKINCHFSNKVGKHAWITISLGMNVSIVADATNIVGIAPDIAKAKYGFKTDGFLLFFGKDAEVRNNILRIDNKEFDFNKKNKISDMIIKKIDKKLGYIESDYSEVLLGQISENFNDYDLDSEIFNSDEIDVLGISKLIKPGGNILETYNYLKLLLKNTYEQNDSYYIDKHFKIDRINSDVGYIKFYIERTYDNAKVYYIYTIKNGLVEITENDYNLL